MNTYQQTIDWMYQQLPSYQHTGSDALNYKLKNIEEFCAHLGNPHHQFKSIHVAGTNGKGSSSHLLSSVLQEAGIKVGLYTSPHLVDFRERIKIDGDMISEEIVIHFISQYQEYIMRHKLSFFEMTVALAFWFFANQNIDMAVIEVGLGGRLDSTNIINPMVSLITNIGYDHMNILGDTLPEIAMEKAGIIKENTPVVISESQKEITAIFENKAKEKNAPLIFADTMRIATYHTDLKGDYQYKNINGVVATLMQLPFEISEEMIQRGLSNVVKNTNLKGRWQQLNRLPKTILDVAHNLSGMQEIVNQLAKEHYKELHLVLGFVSDKDISSILRLLPSEAHYHFCEPSIDRRFQINDLYQLSQLRLLEKVSIHRDVMTAYQFANKVAHQQDMIYVGGSSFVVADFLINSRI